jgi:hypothetical protein
MALSFALFAFLLHFVVFNYLSDVDQLSAKLQSDAATNSVVTSANLFSNRENVQLSSII